VDAQENTYTVEELQAWKANHLARNLLTKYSHLAHQRKCRRILGATFRFETLDAVVVSVEAPQLRRQVAGNAEAYYHETRVWLERQDGTTFSFDFVGEVPCTINDRVTILSVFPEGGSGFSARLYNHRSCHWIQLPMPPISPLNGHDYLSQREIKITMLGLIAIILCVLLLDQFQFGTLTFFGWSVVVLLVACIAAWQAIRRKKLRSVLDRLQEDVDIS
jgi:hypothetical protein